MTEHSLDERCARCGKTWGDHYDGPFCYRPHGTETEDGAQFVAAPESGRELSNSDIVFDMNRTPVAKASQGGLPQDVWYAVVMASKLRLPVIAIYNESDNAVSFQVVNGD